MHLRGTLLSCGFVETESELWEIPPWSRDSCFGENGRSEDPSSVLVWTRLVHDSSGRIWTNFNGNETVLEWSKCGDANKYKLAPATHAREHRTRHGFLLLGEREYERGMVVKSKLRVTFRPETEL